MSAAPPPGPPHRVVDPPSLVRPSGYAHAVVSRGGTTVHLAGQIACGPDGKVRHAGDLVAQVDLALENLLVALRAAGGEAHHVTALRIYVRSADAWRREAKAIGGVWRRRMGRWYPAMALLEVSRLFEPDALVEVEGTAVLP